MSCAKVIECRVGAACNFQVTNGLDEPFEPFPSQYTDGVFVFYADWTTDSPLLLELTTGAGIDLVTGQADGIYYISIGASQSQAMGDLYAAEIPPEGVSIVAVLTVSDPSNQEDVSKNVIPFVLLPGR
jgi:hypothetical protein